MDSEFQLPKDINDCLRGTDKINVIGFDAEAYDRSYHGIKRPIAYRISVCDGYFNSIIDEKIFWNQDDLSINPSMPWFLCIQRRVIEEFNKADIIVGAHSSCDINYLMILKEVMIKNRNKFRDVTSFYSPRLDGGHISLKCSFSTFWNFYSRINT